MKSGITVEICTGSLEDVITASAFAETDRIELNCALELGGLTPSLYTLKAAKQMSTKKIIAMVRPRGAGFIYSANEKDVMFQDAKLFLENGADGIVFGSLNPDHTVDEEFTAKMCSLIHSYGKEAVFHKAFDDAEDPFRAAEALIRCNTDRVLTSGKQPDALKGAELIRRLNDKFGSEIEFLPGGGVNENNITAIIEKSRSKQIHMSAKESIDQDGKYFAVSSSRIRSILAELDH